MRFLLIFTLKILFVTNIFSQIEEDEFVSIKGNPSKVTCKFYKTILGGTAGKIVYHVNSGKILKEEQYDKNKLVSKISYSYNDDGLLKSKEYISSNMDSSLVLYSILLANPILYFKYADGIFG